MALRFWRQATHTVICAGPFFGGMLQNAFCWSTHINEEVRTVKWISRFFDRPGTKPSDPKSHGTPQPESQSPPKSRPDSQSPSPSVAGPDLVAQLEDKLRRLAVRIKEADALESAGKADEAQAAFEECLASVARERFPLTVDLLLPIWMGIGFCHADRNDWAGALKWYSKVEECLHAAPALMASSASKQAGQSPPAWYRHLPEGVIVLFPANFEWKPALANIYDSIAIAFDNNNELEPASDYYNRSASLYHKLGNLTRASQVLGHQAIGCRRREQWPEMAEAAEKMQLVAEAAKDKAAELHSFRLLGQAYANLRRHSLSMASFAKAVLHGRDLKDAGVARDEDTLRKLIQAFRPNMIQTGNVEVVQMLVGVEAIVGAPDLVEDTALLDRLRTQSSQGTSRT